MAYVARVISGNLRLLVGMVGANHPWRLVGRLWRAMLAAVAAVAFGMIQIEVWKSPEPSARCDWRSPVSPRSPPPR